MQHDPNRSPTPMPARLLSFLVELDNMLQADKKDQCYFRLPAFHGFQFTNDCWTLCGCDPYVYGADLSVTQWIAYSPNAAIDFIANGTAIPGSIWTDNMEELTQVRNILAEFRQLSINASENTQPSVGSLSQDFLSWRREVLENLCGYYANFRGLRLGQNTSGWRIRLVGAYKHQMYTLTQIERWWIEVTYPNNNGIVCVELIEASLILGTTDSYFSFTFNRAPDFPENEDWDLVKTDVNFLSQWHIQILIYLAQNGIFNF